MFAFFCTYNKFFYYDKTRLIDTEACLFPAKESGNQPENLFIHEVSYTCLQNTKLYKHVFCRCWRRRRSAIDDVLKRSCKIRYKGCLKRIK